MLGKLLVSSLLQKDNRLEVQGPLLLAPYHRS